MTDPVFEPWTDAVADEAWAALGPTENHLQGVGRDAFGPDRDHPYRRAVLLRDAAGTVLGAAAAWENTPHPTWLRSHVEVVPERRREGLGRAALDRLRALTAEDGRGFHARCLRGSAGHGFVTAVGYGEIQRCRVMRVRPALLGRPSGRYEVTALEVGPGHGPVPQDAVAAYRDAYVSAHGWNPPAPMSVEACRRAFFTSTPARFLTARDRATGRVAGVAFVDPPEYGLDPFATGTGFDGTPVPLDAPDGPAIAADLLLAASAHAPDGELLADMDDAYAAMAAVAERALLRVEEDIVIAATPSR